MPILSTALPSLLDWPRDEAAHSDLPWEIWWISAVLDAGGRRLAAHVLFLHLASGGLHVTATLTDIDRDEELSRTFVARVGEIALPRDRLCLHMPSCRFEGSFADGYTLDAELGDGAGFTLALAPTRPVLHNGGAGQFRFQGVATTQYSIGFLDVSGRVRLGGRELGVTGRAWHDRQWDHGVREGQAAFTWLGLCLDGGDTLSVFDTRTSSDDGHRWATIAAPDGTHIVTAAAPVASDIGRTGRGRAVPRRWALDIPWRQARLELVQRRIADQPGIYTGLLEIAGSYAGRPAAGYGFCDIVGPLDPHAASGG